MGYFGSVFRNNVCYFAIVSETMFILFHFRNIVSYFAVVP